MTKEKKAKRYDEAIEELKGLLEVIHEDKCEIMEEDITNIFPELKKSEDEKIRKWLLDFVQGLPDEGLDFNFYNLSKKQVVAWLEKQKEQSVISHKFNVGDWIVSKWGGIYQIKEVMSGSYNLLCTNNAEEINAITQVDNNSRLLCMSDIKKLEKQGEQKVTYTTTMETGDGGINALVTRDFEIPFGAKDSELHEVTYYIPEGFHAEIEGDEVVIKKGEQKSAWSEEDEEMFDYALDMIEWYIGKNEKRVRLVSDWLKFIKKRIGG